MDYFDKRKQTQIRPIARNLKAPAPPKFIKHDVNFIEPQATTFKSNMLVVQSTQKVRISHYEKGVHLFYVQVESFDAQLQALMTKLQRFVQLIPLKSQPTLLGMACLARYHKKIYRVAIAKVLNDKNNSQDMVICNFVDYGFAASVRMQNIFYIPEEFLNQPTFALPFSFASLKNVTFKSSIQEINFYFKEITEDRLLTLKCVNFDGPPICQYAELYDVDKNIFDLLKSFNTSNLNFLSPNKLETKKDYSVKVCYVESAQEFYVQLQDSKTLLNYDELYFELQRMLQNSPTLHNLKVGLCVGVSIEAEWYRGKIIALCNNNSARVKIVDFGIIEEISAAKIRLLPNRFLNIPLFAICCCLNGFQSIREVSENITTQFEIFCGDSLGDRKIFKMRIENDSTASESYIADLYDSNTPPTHVNQMLLKNSRPLAETITLENARKRQKENQKKAKEIIHTDEVISRDIKSPEKNTRNNAQRGRGNNVSKGVNRSSPSSNVNNNNNVGKRQRTHFDKVNGIDNANAIAGTYFKTTKEATVWGRGNDGETKSNQQQKSSDWNAQAKNIAREQNSDSDWNETDSSKKSNTSQKSKNSKGTNKKNNAENDTSKQKSASKQEKVVNSKQESSSAADDKQIKNLKNGWVSTLITVNEAYVHYEEHIDGLEKILDELYGFYETQKSSLLRNPKAGLIAAFKSQQDSNWYRCEILAVDGDNLKLRNLEYGNIETVQRSNARVLDDRFKKYGKLVEKAFFNIKPNNGSEEELLKEMLKLFNEGTKELKFEKIKNFKNGYILDPIDPENDENLIRVLIDKKKLAIRVNDEELKQILEKKFKVEIEETKQKAEIELEEKKNNEVIVINETEEVVEEIVEPMMKEVAKVPDKNDDKIVAKLTALTSPNNFYLTRVDMLPLFNQLHTDIQILAPAMQPLIDFEYSTYCLAQGPFDNLWYRAKIIDSDESEQSIIVTVLCVDNGKTFSIDNKMCLKTMPKQLQQKTFFGIPCSLPIKVERKLEDDSTELMLKMVENEVQYKILLYTPQKSYIELFYNDENISDVLVQKKFASRFEIFLSGTGYTSHVNSITSFFVQLEVDQLKLDLIASIMERANGKFSKVKEPKVGQIVAAKFPDDDCWYRSKIESIESDGFIVAFIDYGNACLVKEIGTIDESITELPAMSKACTLSKPKGLTSFSEAAEKKFLDITANGATILDIKVMKPGDVTEVELFCDGQNIIDSLTPLCKFESDLNEF
ncbi:hypothetical protein PVAND_014069 [Polypedilum vanderplanki]|uniref:Tudor domain-containing protein n=1 Tax=Polypedilum vanderplanki TaxID=319348 RepID=A0A9J6CTB6_POLVA|nr:hypothetical protein PVAND_014069 [Polypedilum vanderplanki]